jgi:hypothetical protein
MTQERKGIAHVPTKGVLARESAVAHVTYVIADVQMNALGMSHQVGVADECFPAIGLGALVWTWSVFVVR